MYGGSGKLGRGGGGGGGGGRGGGAAAGKRNIHSTFNPSPLHRPSAASGSRLSVSSGAGPRNRSGNSGATTSAPPAAEETFSLVTGNPLNFAMIIRLTPDLVEEIKRVEAQGGTARIKFDSNGSNSSGNVIDLGGKDFRFTWSREMGDLCDIYEERQSGEDGNGLLVESGCAWRKLNVHRILDESTKNHVKMRSEEAEKKLKSRKAIVLDHGNPSMKSQIKALAAVEVNPWRFKQKKEPPFKKRKVDPPPVAVGGPPKAANKSGLFSTTPAKGRHSVSPLPSPPEHSNTLASPFGAGNLTKGLTSVEDVPPISSTSKENVTSFEKEVPGRTISGAVREKTGLRGNLGAKQMDLQSMLISLLMENPKGMSLKALEKSIGDAIPNSVRKIEPILKKIATFQAPGRYLLKPGVELENFRKPSSESGSYSEDSHHQAPVPEDNHDQIPAAKQDCAEKAAIKEAEEQAELNTKVGEESDSLDKIDIQNHSPDRFGDKKVSDNSEGPAGSSSDSGSDSDSDSDSSDSGSDSGSHSRSRSKSRSPVGSGSGSSSDSESDASSNSKEGSDEDVDIMTSDDDKESKHKMPDSEPRFSRSPIPWRTSDAEPLQNESDDKQDGHGLDIVEIEKDLPDDDQKNEMAIISNSTPTEEGEKAVEESRENKYSSPDRHEHQETQVYTGKLFCERGNKDAFKHEQSDSSERISKGKSKRVSDSKHLTEKSDHAKRVKAGSLAQPQSYQERDSLFSESPQRFSPNRLIDDPYKGPSMTNRALRDGSVDSGLQKGYNQAIPGKPISDSQQSDRRSIDLSVRVKAPDPAERPVKHAESLGRGVKFSERSLQVNEGFPIQKEKVHRGTHYEDGYSEKKLPRGSKADGVGDKHLAPADSRYAKYEVVGKFKEVGQVSNSHTIDNRSDVDRSPVINGRGSMLRRELSDLELGELREPLPEETAGVKKQFERKSSFKQLENKPSTSDYWNSDLSKGKPAGKISIDSVKHSPGHVRAEVPSNPDSSSSKKTPENHIEDLTRPQNRIVQPPSQLISRVDHAETVSHFDKFADESSKTRHNAPGVNQNIVPERFRDTNKKALGGAPQQHDSKRGLVPHSKKGSKMKKSNSLADLSNGRKGASLTESNDGGLKRRESSSDDNSCSYSKYEKEEPEFKGPIKDLSQYKEYVQEYREKYDSYCSLNKILESYRTEFQKLGRDLESAKGKDMERYYNMLEQLKESYRQCGTRHKRLKKIFVVLHEELKHLKLMIKNFAALS
ncbi:uncharacterized protein LOC132282498 [Cornus florida]|uniref:uncharacterized protein LOC132282498 n=1 Tax=Cornus florida TaxID=4283 RepID=UPI002897EA1E|nr:uncharacterized protein LOC132282498 [Cornus florida]